MANVKVQFKSFKWDRNGYRNLKNTSRVQMELATKAAGILNRANASAQTTNGFKCQQVVLPRAKDLGYRVKTNTKKARRMEAENNILLKSIK